MPTAVSSPMVRTQSELPICFTGQGVIAVMVSLHGEEWPASIHTIDAKRVCSVAKLGSKTRVRLSDPDEFVDVNESVQSIMDAMSNPVAGEVSEEG